MNPPRGEDPGARAPPPPNPPADGGGLEFPGKRTTPAGGESGGRHLGAARGGGAGPRLHGRERSVTSMVYPKRSEGKLARVELRRMMKKCPLTCGITLERALGRRRRPVGRAGSRSQGLLLCVVRRRVVGKAGERLGRARTLFAHLAALQASSRTAYERKGGGCSE